MIYIIIFMVPISVWFYIIWFMVPISVRFILLDSWFLYLYLVINFLLQDAGHTHTDAGHSHNHYRAWVNIFTKFQRIPGAGSMLPNYPEILVEKINK